MVNRLGPFRVLHRISDRIATKIATVATPKGGSIGKLGYRRGVWAGLILSLATLPLPGWALTQVLRPDLNDLEVGFVLGIVDNTTLLMQVEGRSEVQVVQLLGLESLPPLTPSWTVLTGEPALPVYEAGQYLQDTLSNKQVYLEIDEAVIAPNGVLPAYVWRDRRLINQEMLFLGHALISDSPAAIKYDAVLDEARVTAERQGRGVWSFYGPSPESDL